MAWFTFTDASNETFVIRLTDSADVAHARAVLAGTETDATHVAGTVVKSHVQYNIGWSYHIQDIFFFDLSAEVGDSTMRYIQQHLAAVGGALLPGSVWTGWSSALVGELDPLQGSTGNDSLGGSGQADILFGNAGDDAVSGLAGNDYVIGGAGLDALLGGSGDDKLDGGAGADTLLGGGGADVLVGGDGSDRVHAGADDHRDLVVYQSKAELLATDQVFQFDFKGTPGELVWDRIDLRSIDADATMSGNQAFRFVEAFAPAAAGRPDGQLRVVDQGANVHVELDFNGDSVADAYIVVRNVASLSQADFLL